MKADCVFLIIFYSNSLFFFIIIIIIFDYQATQYFAFCSSTVLTNLLSARRALLGRPALVYHWLFYFLQFVKWLWDGQSRKTERHIDRLTN